MPAEFLTSREAKQRDIDVFVLLQDAAQNSLFRKCEFLLKIGEKCVVHEELLCVQALSEKGRRRSRKVFSHLSATRLVAIRLSTCECGGVLILRDKCLATPAEWGSIAVRVSCKESEHEPGEQDSTHGEQNVSRNT